MCEPKWLCGTAQNYWIPDGVPKQTKSKAELGAKETAGEGPPEEGSGVDADADEEGSAEPEQVVAAAPAAKRAGETSGLTLTLSLHQLASIWMRA